MSDTPKPRVLVVDPDACNLDYLNGYLGGRDFEQAQHATAHQASKVLAEGGFTHLMVAANGKASDLPTAPLTPTQEFLQQLRDNDQLPTTVVVMTRSSASEEPYRRCVGPSVKLFVRTIGQLYFTESIDPLFE